MTPANLKVREWSERFRQTPLAGSIVARLDRRAAEIWQRTFDLLQRESPEYRNSVDDEFTRESKSHCGELLHTIIAVAAGRADWPDVDPFHFVRSHAEWRARHHVPLTASLHAYRLAHKTYWEISRESLLDHAQREEALYCLSMLSDFWIEFFDYVGAVLAESHAVEEGLSIAQNTRTYVNLIDDLLRGHEPATAEARRLRLLCGVRPGVPMAVAVARPFPSGNGKPIDLDATRRSLVRLLQQALPSASFGKLVDVRDDEVVAVVASDGTPSHNFLTVMCRHKVSSGMGVSLDTAVVAGLPAALEEARLALDFASRSKPVMHFADIDLAEFLIRRADPAALRLIPAWIRQDQSAELSQTIRAFAESSLNVKQTASRLGVHANTVYFRLNRIHKLSGIDPRTFAGTSLLLTALRLLDTQRTTVKSSC